MLRFGCIGLAFLTYLQRPTLAGDVTAAAPGQESPHGHPLAGCWRIEYHPNRAVRVYSIDADGLIRFDEPGRWTGLLARSPDSDSRWRLTFCEDTVSRTEELTLCADGRLLVEHYNPAARLAQGLPPDQIGLGQHRSVNVTSPALPILVNPAQNCRSISP